MIKFTYFKFILLFAICCITGCKESGNMGQDGFITVSGVDLIRPDGTKLLIKGTNLSNWLNPEGYMFNFGEVNSFTRINQMFCELVGPSYTSQFWKDFKDNYITHDDISFIASCGANTIRIPFHYKIFTNEDYMGVTSDGDGFSRIDSVLSWCRDAGLYVILDMHAAPGGQTGYNIDDSYGYPWLFESRENQNLFCEVWQKIASYYKDEPLILGYELLNEPIASYFPNIDILNLQLEPLYKRATAAIREVDKNHIIILGAPQWNLNFTVFTDAKFDDKLMYTCHKYDGEPTSEGIRDFIAFRDSVNLPMYMGEIGHNPDEWQEAFCKVMEENNIGYTFWPYKKVGNQSFVSVKEPDGWKSIRKFAETPRMSYRDIYIARPNQDSARCAMKTFIENSRFENCIVHESYITSLRLKSSND